MVAGRGGQPVPALRCDRRLHGPKLLLHVPKASPMAVPCFSRRRATRIRHATCRGGGDDAVIVQRTRLNGARHQVGLSRITTTQALPPTSTFCILFGPHPSTAAWLSQGDHTMSAMQFSTTRLLPLLVFVARPPACAAGHAVEG